MNRTRFYNKTMLLVAILLLAVVSHQAQSEYQLILPTLFKQGSAYFIECRGFFSGSTLQFEFSDKTKSPKFPLVGFYTRQRGHRGKKQRDVITAFVCGIHPLAAPGPAVIKVFDSRNTILHTQTITITAEPWQKEDVFLNSALTELITKPDPEKEAQAKRYQKVLATINATGIWLTKPLEFPVSKPRITSHFGVQRHYIYANGTKGITFHAGIDFGKEQDTTIYAAEIR